MSAFGLMRTGDDAGVTSSQLEGRIAAHVSSIVSDVGTSRSDEHLTRYDVAA
jgi:hypothetical protein